MLINKATRKEIKVGDSVTDFRGEKATVTDIADLVYIMNDSGVPTQPYGVNMGVIGAEWMDDDLVQDIRTQEVHDWMKAMSDDQKQVYAINWKMAHTLFNISCKYKPSEELQGIDWYKIYKSRDMGRWSHGGKVIVQISEGWRGEGFLIVGCIR